MQWFVDFGHCINFASIRKSLQGEHAKHLMPVTSKKYDIRNIAVLV